ADAATVIEIQTLLKRKGLYPSDIDGKVGKLTIEGFAKFKESIWLDSPELIGPSVAGALIEIAVGHSLSEQALDTQSEPLPESSQGDKTGKTMKLPNGTIVYERELIVEGIPLTWGEFTQGCTRVPERNEIVNNMIKTAKGFGKIRQTFGSPLRINSGYRPPAINRAVGGARASQHIHGLALDISPINGSMQKLFEICRASDCTGLGRGMHRGFVHIDWRAGGRVVFDYP
ncbi:MAG: D-Ala-D-Ala carboxypeptidase family metallohydrolase, partial [Sphaerospermopsis kisseleviana]